MNTLPRAAEVVIIGAGFAGAATAWWLARRGVKDVLLLEREATTGVYASGRCVGMGRQLADDDVTTALTVRGAAFLRQPPAGFPAVWTASGGVLGFDDATARDGYAARAARFGVEVVALDGVGVATRWPAVDPAAIGAGLWIPSDGLIDVWGMLPGFLVGVDLRCGVGVERVVGQPGGALVSTTHGEVAARVVVDASGAWAGRLVGDRGFVAKRRTALVIDAPAPAGAPFFWHTGAQQIYLRPDDGLVVTSPCEAEVAEPADQEATPEAEVALRVKLAAVTPSWRDAAVARSWACLRTFAPDGLMRLTRDPTRPWLVWSAGLGGHGATAAPAVGEVVAAAVMAALATA